MGPAALPATSPAAHPPRAATRAHPRRPRRRTPPSTRTWRATSSTSTAAAAPAPPGRPRPPSRGLSRLLLPGVKVNPSLPLLVPPESSPNRREPQRSRTGARPEPPPAWPPTLPRPPRASRRCLSRGAIRTRSSPCPRPQVLLTMLLCPPQTEIASGTPRAPPKPTSSRLVPGPGTTTTR